MDISIYLRSVLAFGFLVVAALPISARGEKPRDLFWHQHVPFPKLRLIRQQVEFSSIQCGIPVEIKCSSLLGPECLFSTLLKGATGKTPAAEHIEELPARRDTDKATRTVSGGIMDQYMEASQSQLGSVHSDSWASSEGGEGRQAGSKAGQRLDDVVMVKVGRSVKSVYHDDDQEDRLTEEATAVDDRPAASARVAEHSRGEYLEGRKGGELASAEAEEHCESGLGDGSKGGGTNEEQLMALKELDTTEQMKQIGADKLLQEHEYYDHYFNSSIVDPDDEYYIDYDDAYYLPAN